MDSLTAPAMVGLLRRDIPMPLYHQLHQFLRGKILQGEICHGVQLPREQDLATALGVSRVTMRRALNDLAKEGLLSRQRGRGTSVIYEPTPPATPSLHTPLGELEENLQTLASNTEVELLDWARLLPPEPVREAFGLGVGQELVHCLRVRSRNGRPFGYYSSWTRIEHPDFNAAALAREARVAIFARCGIRIARVEQSVSAANADAVAALKLEMSPGEAVLTLERRSYDKDNQLLDLLNIQYRPDQLRYQIRLDYESVMEESHS